MGSGRLALLAGLVAAGLSALLAGAAGVTETEILTRAAISFVVFALLTKGAAAIVVYLVPEVAGARPVNAPGAKGSTTNGSANGPAPPDDRGGRLNVVLPGTSTEEMLNAGSGKEVAG